MKVLPAALISEITYREEALSILRPSFASESTVRNVRHMAAKVRALSYRMPLFVRAGNRGFTYSISGWHGAV